MFKDLFKKKDEQPDQKRKIENIVVFIIILIITVLIINQIWSSEEANDYNYDSNKVLASTSPEKDVSADTNNLEKELEDILETINGVGKVKVLIKYSESNKVMAMYNETSSENKTEENTEDGDTKSTTEKETKKEIAYSDENGDSKPITEKVVMPVIEGAIITAEGASNANIKSSIVSAVEAVTGLAVHKIQVFEMEKSK